MKNLTLLFATTTKGHFGRSDIYLKTLNDWKENGYLDNFEFKIAHIKDGGPEESDSGAMIENLRKFDFLILLTEGKFTHFNPSHSLGQLQDIGTLISTVKTEYVFFLEDDFLIRPKNNNLEFHLSAAVNLLNSRADVIQVRIPRHSDDFPHYKTLQQTGAPNPGWLKQNDIFSFNPFVARTSDMQILRNSVFGYQDKIVPLINENILNSELTYTILAKELRGPDIFWSFDSKNIQSFHLGTKDGEEDKIILN